MPFRYREVFSCGASLPMLAQGPMDGRLVARLAWTTCACSFALAVASVVLHVLNRSVPPLDRNPWWAMTVVLGVGFGAIGALIASRQRANPIGWVFLGVGVAEALHGASLEYGVYALVTAPGWLGGMAALWLASWTWMALGLLLVVLLLFPDGRLPAARWRPVLVLAAVLPGLFMLGRMIDPASMNVPQTGSFPGLGNPLGLAAAAPVLRVLGGVLVPLLFATFVASLVAAGMRFRRASGQDRQQFKWVVFGVALTGAVAGLAFIVVPDPARPVVGAVGVGLLVATIGVAILRYRLYDIDVIVNRALVYGALTACVAGAYTGMVVVLGALFQRRGSLTVSLVATGVVALGFAPLRSRLQRGVDQLLYGQRSDPIGVIARLGARLEGASGPQQVLPTLVETVARTLKLPYAAITLDGDSDSVAPAASHGQLVGDPLRLPLVYQGQPVGQLLLGPRTPGEAFTPADLRLFESLAHQAGVAAYAVRLSTDLQRSRERLVSAREEERRRLRRDLHDGLGPALAGVAFGIQAARNLLGQDPARADALLDQALADTHHSVADIRRLVYDLRPPALDELGLVAALREQAAHFGAPTTGPPGDGTGLQVRVEAPEELPPLPAAVEVASYRIALEGLTNVARHAAATSCILRLGVGCAKSDVASELPVRSTMARKVTPPLTRLGGCLRAVEARLPDAVPLHPAARTPRSW
jgi:two-component system NarL family sensor kinase